MLEEKEYHAIDNLFPFEFWFIVLGTGLTKKAAVKTFHTMYFMPLKRAQWSTSQARKSG